MTQPIIFISYSQQDEKEKEELLSHLGVLRHAGLVDLWSDGRIRAGSDWQQEIYRAISQANVAVLLISANFLNSEFILNNQMPRLPERSQRDGLIIFPVIARACAWKTVPWLARLSVRPKHEKPVWRDGGRYVDEELAGIANEIIQLLEPKMDDQTKEQTKDTRPAAVPPPSPTGQAIKYHSCFISYSSKDQDFAEKLHDDLQQRGVQCWFAPEDMKIGDKIRPTLHRSIQAHDKLLLILSQNSINSGWVETEVETAFEKEQRQGQIVLFPIRLDETVIQTDQAWAADIRRTRHIGDFSRWKDHDQYQRAFERRLRNLKAEN